jgi:hypothetical protein
LFRGSRATSGNFELPGTGYVRRHPSFS